MYENVGALNASDGTDIPTKKALKDALAANPANVVLYTTSGFSPKKHIKGTELEVGVRYSVTGPNPYSARNWYATVTIANGKIKVS